MEEPRIKITAVRRQLKSGGYAALFRAEVTGIDEDSLPSVSLSRKKGGCMYRIDKMHEHDYHAPMFSQVDGDSGMNQYIKRVLTDISDGLQEAGIAAKEEVEEVAAVDLPPNISIISLN